jgi:N-acetylneuraminic acid mutarotase
MHDKIATTTKKIMEYGIIMGLMLAFHVCLVHESIADVPSGNNRILSLEERIQCQEAIERVYWKHRIWPKENIVVKPAFKEVMTADIIREKVTDAIQKSNALEQYWHRPLTGYQLQSEMNRMSKRTRQPEVLKELWTALGNNPHMIAECLVRPILADRFIRNWYKLDENAEVKGQSIKGFDAWWQEARQNISKDSNEPRYRYVLPDINAPGCTDDSWERTAGPPDPRYGHSAIWTGTEMIIWGGEDYDLGLNTGARYNPATDTWTSTSLTGAPSIRAYHSAIWTGTEMIIWGGYYYDAGSHYVNTGGRYNPTTDAWAATSMTNVPPPRSGHTVVWTGSLMIVWGGHGSSWMDSGGRYNPSTDTWAATTMTNVPTSRESHTAVWTGTEMIIWGGYVGSNLDTGSRYNPSTDIWTALPTTGAPTARRSHTAIWTGSLMVVWGGYDANGYADTGGRYNPTSNSWSSTSTTNVPTAREYHTAVWTGSVMIVWGGYYLYNSGGRYNPASDTWTATSTTGAPTARYYHTAILTSTEMIIWGGMDAYSSSVNTGGRYNIASDSWVPTSVEGAPLSRERHTAIWTGTEMIIWGGFAGGLNYLNDGAKYVPATDSWTAISTANAPSGRWRHTAVWTGSLMIVWGGSYQNTFLNTGGRYNPTTNTWTATSLINPPGERYSHTAVWTGSVMVIWGGQDSTGALSTGRRYYPGTDTWDYTSAYGCPGGRVNHTAIWTGIRMIVWGGQDATGALNTGGQYDPVNDTWSLTTTTNAPHGRTEHTAVWSDYEMIVWGGWYYEGQYYYLNTGGRYNAVTNSWIATSLTDAPQGRYAHRAVWTGQHMIIWGGNWIGGSSNNLNTGGRYNPGTNTWIATSTVDAPLKRSYHSAIWATNKMIVWGGEGGFLNTGGSYCSRFVKLEPYQGKKPVVDDTGSPTHNSIIEPNETVVLLGHIQNTGNDDALSAAGNLSTADPITITQPDAVYGTVAADGNASCSSCYQLQAPSANRPATHWDFKATEKLTAQEYGPAGYAYTYHIGNSFNDVSVTGVFYPFIETVLHAGAASGCSTTSYCPLVNVQRQNMAKFICKSMSVVNPSSCRLLTCANVFADVPSSNIFCSDIEALYTAGVVSGCQIIPYQLYCPSGLVQRQSMAKFVCLGMEKATPGSCSLSSCSGIFTDVPSSNVFCSYIEALYNAGVISGCSGNAYCPLGTVTREQMSKFIVNGFHFSL